MIPNQHPIQYRITFLEAEIACWETGDRQNVQTFEGATGLDMIPTRQSIIDDLKNELVAWRNIAKAKV